MPKVAYVSVPPDLKDRYSQQFQPLYKTKDSSVRWNGGLIAPRKKYKITTKSLLPGLAALWNELDGSTKLGWKAAGEKQGYNAYNTFIQDTAYRMKFGIEGTATPSIYHSYKVGEIVIAAPATQFKLVQAHPVEYFKLKKVKGTKSQYEPFAIEEVLTLPLSIGFSYRSNLTAVGDNPYCKLYAEVTYSYQGLDKTTRVETDISLVADWGNALAALSQVVGHARWYTLAIEFNNVQGTLQFDLVRAYHGGTNFARDFRCTNINAGFSNTNYQLPPSWEAAEAVDGVLYGSVYPSEDDL